MEDKFVEIDKLIVKYLQQQITAAETTLLEEWKAESPENKFVFDQLTSAASVKGNLERIYMYDKEKGWKKIESGKWKVESGEEEKAGSRESLVVSPSTPLRIKLWKRIAVAAGIVGVLFVAGYWLMKDKTTDDPSTIAQGEKTNDVKAPDKNRAQIKLADGTIVYLDSAGNGQLALQGNVKLVKNANGEIVYEATDDEPQTWVQYNTLFNPRGSKVQPLLLDDGTKVWLNSESSITYPTAFVTSERKVEITGEAYFEVAKNASKKFYVTGAGVTTEVLGTHFNVNTFRDEGVVRVTLLEGSVEVKSKVGSGKSKVIKPGEQAVSLLSGELSVNKDVDVEEVMAWKNGLFQFNRANIVMIMRQVERWYDVEVVFEQNDLKEKDFTGGIGRAENVSEVLKMLERTGVLHFKVEGRKIIVSR
jgi:transmembrane sensor